MKGGGGDPLEEDGYLYFMAAIVLNQGDHQGWGTISFVFTLLLRCKLEKAIITHHLTATSSLLRHTSSYHTIIQANSREVLHHDAESPMQSRNQPHTPSYQDISQPLFTSQLYPPERDFTQTW